MFSAFLRTTIFLSLFRLSLAAPSHKLHRFFGVGWRLYTNSKAHRKLFIHIFHDFHENIDKILSMKTSFGIFSGILFMSSHLSSDTISSCWDSMKKSRKSWRRVRGWFCILFYRICNIYFSVIVTNERVKIESCFSLLVKICSWSDFL